MTLSERWCVRHRDGWCATKNGKRHADTQDSVPTKCGYFVILPGGSERRAPDCPDCLAALTRAMEAETGDVRKTMEGK
jgi:hypothetical protein